MTLYLGIKYHQLLPYCWQQNVFNIEIYMNVRTSIIPLTSHSNLELLELCRNWIQVHIVILLIQKIQSVGQTTFSFRLADTCVYKCIIYTYANSRFQKKSKCAIYCKIQWEWHAMLNLPPFDLMRWFLKHILQLHLPCQNYLLFVMQSLKQYIS